MSAEDGYLILATLGRDDSTEFRIVWTQIQLEDWSIISDCNSLDEDHDCDSPNTICTKPPLDHEFVRRVFTDGFDVTLVYDEEEAWQLAEAMDEGQAKWNDGYASEHGILMIDYREIPFPTL